MKTAYLDCFSGISGDMFLGTLLDVGLPFKELERAIASLPLAGYSLDVKREKKNSLMATRFIVGLSGKTHEHRGLKDIKRIISEGDLSDAVKKKSIHVFESIAEEEGKIHNHSPEEVHFHEVGAVDSIIDIVGTAFGIEYLEIISIYASRLPLGSGFTETRHGRIPLPSPATLALLKGIPVYDSGLKYELVTPTGAALIKEFADSFGSMPPMTVDSVGYGAGSRDLPDRPNLLRILLGEEIPGEQTDTVIILEANLDDTNPEWLGFLMDRLFESGALDVIFCPVQMKKNRPGIQVQIMGKPHQMNDLMDILFRESTTLGVRFRYSQRKILKRSEIEIDSPWGKMNVKKVIRPDGSSFLQPEYESCRRIAEGNSLSLKEVYYWIMSKNRT
ncbi:nickel pincer cofactor biosynthesis protein LarC [Thermodesulfobacteriota bacterium]